jgi:hypothetical protein
MSWRLLFWHWAIRPASRAACTAGNKSAMSTPIMLIATSNSTRINPWNTDRKAARAMRPAQWVVPAEAAASELRPMLSPGNGSERNARPAIDSPKSGISDATWRCGGTTVRTLSIITNISAEHNIISHRRSACWAQSPYRPFPVGGLVPTGCLLHTACAGYIANEGTGCR